MTFYKINGETTTKEVYEYLIIATKQNEEQCSKVYKDKHNNTYHNIFMSNKLLMLVLNSSINYLIKMNEQNESISNGKRDYSVI